MIINEIKNTISKSALNVSSSVSRFYYNYVPQNTSYPFVVYTLIDETYSKKDTGILYSDLVVQFSVFSNLNDYGTQANKILKDIIDYYDFNFIGYANNIIGTGSVISCIRNFVRPAYFIEGVWQAIVQYTIHVKN